MPDFLPLEMFPIVLFFISFFGLVTSKNIIKSIIFTMLFQSAVVMFWLIFGSYHGTLPPMGYYHPNPYAVADPLPQALMITAIIIGISVTAINITMFITLFRKYETADWNILETAAKEREN